LKFWIPPCDDMLFFHPLVQRRLNGFSLHGGDAGSVMRANLDFSPGAAITSLRTGTFSFFCRKVFYGHYNLGALIFAFDGFMLRLGGLPHRRGHGDSTSAFSFFFVCGPPDAQARRGPSRHVAGAIFFTSTGRRARASPAMLHLFSPATRNIPALRTFRRYLREISFFFFFRRTENLPWLRTL